MEGLSNDEFKRLIYSLTAILDEMEAQELLTLTTTFEDVANFAVQKYCALC